MEDELTTILQLLSDSNLLQVMATVLVTVAYAFAAQRFLFKSRQLRSDRKKKLWEALSNGFAIGGISSVEDVVNIYKGIHRLSGDDVSYRAGLEQYTGQGILGQNIVQLRIFP